MGDLEVTDYEGTVIKIMSVYTFKLVCHYNIKVVHVTSYAKCFSSNTSGGWYYHSQAQ